MPTLTALASATKALLDATDFEGFDGEVTSTPSGPYWCLFDQPANSSADRVAAAGGSQDLTWTVYILCGGRSRDGVRDVTNAVRDALVDQWLNDSPATGPLFEIPGGPLMPDGSDGDRRTSQTLIFRCYTTRS